MTNQTKVPFEIIRMDPFGQGVAQHEDKMLFIPKTLPGEKGVAKITETKGQKVLFGKIDTLEEPSLERQNAPCPHYQECQGCSFLHTSYESELHHKKKAYSFLFKKYLPEDKISIIPAPNRLHYRNRIQLHYERKKRKLGFLSEGKIHNVPGCLLGKESLKAKFKELYESDHWLTLLPNKAPASGHIELYEKTDGKIQVAINEPYAHGGFTQVYEEMGVKAKDLITEFFARENDNSACPTLDVFGGHGFLSEGIGKSRLVCDTIVPEASSTSKNSFVTVNLFEKYAMARIEKKIHKHLKDNKYSPEMSWNVIVDPPRSGFKTLSKLTNLDSLKGKINKLAYLSCHPQTFKRDLDILMETNNWELENLIFLDFFPATHHLESLAFLVPKK